MNRQSKSLFIKYFLPYLGFLLFLIILSGIYYNSTLKLVQKENMEHTLQRLEQSAYLGDLRVSELEKVVTNLATDSRVREFLNIENISGSDFMKFITSWNTMPIYSVTDEFLIDSVLYSRQTNSMISPYGAVPAIDSFYNSLIEISHLNYQDWREEYLEQYQTFNISESSAVKVNFNSLDGIVIYQTLPIGYQNINKGTIILVVDPALFSSPLQDRDNENTWYYILDNQDKVLTSRTSPELLEIYEKIEFDEESGYSLYTSGENEWFVAYAISERYGWKYVMGIQKDKVLGKVYQIRNISLIFISLSIILGLIVAIILSRYNSRPIQKILTSLSDELSTADQENAIEKISRSIKQMTTSNTYLKNALSAQEPLLKAQIIGKVLKGAFTDEDELKKSLEEVRISIGDGPYMACIIRLEEELKSNKQLQGSHRSEDKALIRSLVNDVLGASAFLYDWDNDKLAILFSFAGSQKVDTIRKYVETVLGGVKLVLFEKHKIQTLCSGGGLYNSLVEVYRSIVEAEDVLIYATSLWLNPVCWFNAEHGNNEQYYYPMEMEQRLINLIKAGQSDVAVEVIDELFRENIDNRVLSVHMMLLLGGEVFSTLMKSSARLTAPDGESQGFSFSRHMEELHGWRKKIRDSKSLVPIQALVTGLCRDICDIVAEQRRHPKYHLKNKFLTFLSENQGDPNLSLTVMADYFNLTEAYISHMFKEQTGEKLSNYLEKIRIKKATELLQENYVIDEIVHMTGYQYKNTFYKAFKRVMNISPGQYRDNFLLDEQKKL